MNDLPPPPTPALDAPPASWWQRRVVAPIVAQLRQGTSPEKIALSIALGVVLGIFPILGATTLLCGVVAWRLRLNQPLIQLTNYLMYPVHLLMLLPFYRAGETLFQQPHVPIFSVDELAHRFIASPLAFLRDYSLVGLYGVVVWSLVALPLAVLLYVVLRPAVRSLHAGLK